MSAIKRGTLAIESANCIWAFNCNDKTAQTRNNVVGPVTDIWEAEQTMGQQVMGSWVKLVDKCECVTWVKG